MRDEQGAGGFELGAGDERRGLVDHGAHELVQPLVGNGESEERRHGGRYLMPQVGKPLQGSGPWLSACGEADVVEILELAHRRYLNACAQLHAEPPAVAEEAIDDGLRRLGGGEYAAVGLRRESHAVALKPSVGIAMVERMEETEHELMSTRIDRAEVANGREAVGAVAAPAARHLHLLQHTLRAFENDDAHLRAHLLEVDGQEEACRATAYDGRGIW